MSSEEQTRGASGYIEVKGGPKCGNCKFVTGSNCALWSYSVDLANGCCDSWVQHIGESLDYRQRAHVKWEEWKSMQPKS